MRPTVDVPASGPCAFLSELVGLLAVPHVDLRGETLADRVDRLERDAHRGGAPEATVAAIESARALLRLAEAPVVFVVRPGAVH